MKNNDKDFINYIHGFVEKEENKLINKELYDIGIYTIGFSPYTTILSLSSIKPKEKVILLFTKDSLKFIEVFKEYLNMIELNVELVIRETISDGDAAEVFNVILDEIKKYSSKKIAVDITGGKKPTIAAGYLAASLYNRNSNIDILYLDFHQYENDIPTYGTEYLSKLLNPNDLFNTIEQRALEEMYSSHNFKGARRLSKDIENRLKRNANILVQYNIEWQIDEISKIYYFSKLYELRNNFDYSSIIINNKFLSSREIKAIRMISRFLDRMKYIESELNLNRSKTIEEMIYKEFGNSNEILYMVLDRYNGALMMKNIDLQSYIMRLFSVIELTGIVLTKGKVKESIDKINVVGGKRLKEDLHGLRKLRNNLSLTHGFKAIAQPDPRYENAVIEYISLGFGRSKKEIKELIYQELRYRRFNEIK